MFNISNLTEDEAILIYACVDHEIDRFNEAIWACVRIDHEITRINEEIDKSGVSIATKNRRDFDTAYEDMRERKKIALGKLRNLQSLLDKLATGFGW